jgi:DNA-binding response OmpR family regulator
MASEAGIGHEISAAGGNMSRILVIDDDRGVTSVLKRGLTYEGYTVDTAESGYEGLTIARDRVPDLVILDLMLPGLDGLGVLKRLRAADAHLPVIMLTARDAPADQVQGLERGAVRLCRETIHLRRPTPPG